MARNIDELFEAARHLSVDERTVLAHRIWQSVEEEPADPEVEAAWIAEIRRRVDAHERGETKSIPYEEAMRQIEATLEEFRRGR